MYTVFLAVRAALVVDEPIARSLCGGSYFRYSNELPKRTCTLGRFAEEGPDLG